MLRKIVVLLCVIVIGQAQAAEQKVTLKDITAPVMKHREFNPVIGFTIKSTKAGALKAVLLDIDKTNSKDLKEIAIYRASLDKNGSVQTSGADKPLGILSRFRSGKKRYTINCSGGKLKRGSNHFWVSVKVANRASVKRFVDLRLLKLKTNTGTLSIDDASCRQRIGVAVTYPNFSVEIRKAVSGKLLKKRTSKYSRIPGLTVTKKGTIIATFDNRYNHNGDLPADIDVAVSRSTDGGNTWSPVITCINASDIPGIGHGVGDPAILLDEANNRVWIAGLAAPKTGHPIWKSQTGTTDPAKCGQFILVYSDNEGKNWSRPINITADIKRLGDADTKSWGCVFQGPGNGICMRNGTLVFPAQIWGLKNNKMGNKRFAVLVYSQDGGRNWKSSKAMEFGGSESTVAELSDGSLMVNTREGAGGWRQVGVTKDMGETWEKHKSVNTAEGRLRNPFCQGNLIALFNSGISAAYNFGKKINHALIFTNPNAGSRCRMTLKVSTDDGNTWSKGLLYDERGGMGYSAIYPIDRDYLGVFYESQHQYLHFIAIRYEEIFRVPLEHPVIQRNRAGLVTIDSNGKIFYTLDGSRPTRKSKAYISPFKLPRGGVVKAISLRKEEQSKVTTMHFDIAKTKWSIKAVSSHNARTGEGAEKAIDDDPQTLWHSKWSGGTDSMPHSITINFGEALALKGVTYLPRQGTARGGILDKYRVELSTNGENWTQAAEGIFEDIKNDLTIQEVRFAKTYNGIRYLRFTGLHSIENLDHTSAAEIGVLTR